MRRLFWFCVAMVLIGGVTLPVLYFVYARDLPDLDTPDQVRTAVARSVEAERRATTVVGLKWGKVDFELITPQKAPRALVTGVLAMDSCPEFLTTRMETGYPRVKRLVTRWLLNRHLGKAGPAACQLAYADTIAASLGVADSMHFAIADARILGALQPDDLLAYRMSVMYFAEGVTGAREGARRLFKKDLGELQLSQVAELLAAEHAFPEYYQCKNPGKLKLWRDSVLDRMEAFRAISPEEAKAARARPLTCALTP